MTDEVEMWDYYKLHCVLLTPLLGTLPKDRNVLERHVQDMARKQADERIPETPEDVETRGHTTFPVDEQGRPVMLDYQVKGTLKEAGNVIKATVGVKNLRSHIEQGVFVSPRMMVLADAIDDEAEERPLRAMTQQGPRVTVVRSDRVSPPHEYEWDVKVLKDSVVSKRVLDVIAEYMEVKAFLQWRNGGFGRVKAEFRAVNKDGSPREVVTRTRTTTAGTTTRKVTKPTAKKVTKRAIRKT